MILNKTRTNNSLQKIFIKNYNKEQGTKIFQIHKENK